MYDWNKKVVVLTGGASGMGRSFITHILSRGGFISFGDFNTALSKSLLLQIHSTAPRLVSRLLFTKADIRDGSQLRHLFTRTVEVFGKVDCLLCVAGVNVPDCFLPQSIVGQENANLLNIEVNLMGTINTIYAGLPHLKDDARVVVVSSTAGIYPSSVQPLYSASKHGLIGFTRAMAPLLPRGQRIFVLAPSTYLPPHHNASKGLTMSHQMEQAGEGDVFTKVIGETLGFLDMHTILLTLDDSLSTAASGDVLEISPLGVAKPSFPAIPPQFLRMETALRQQVCGLQDVEQQEQPSIKEEKMDT